VLRFVNRHFCARALAVTALGAWACWVTPLEADEIAAPTAHPLEEVVVRAKKRPEFVPDEEVTEHVATALHTDRYFYDGHVTVTVKDGVVYLRGTVFDEGDLRHAWLISKKIPGVKRVVNELEICTCDGGA
jgi:hypothetical protein